MCVLDVGVRCLHPSTIVTSSRVHDDVLSREGRVDLKLVSLTNSADNPASFLVWIAYFNFSEWKLTKV